MNSYQILRLIRRFSALEATLLFFMLFIPIVARNTSAQVIVRAQIDSDVRQPLHYQFIQGGGLTIFNPDRSVFQHIPSFASEPVLWDYDGDGYNDLVYTTLAEFGVYRNLSGTGFEAMPSVVKTFAPAHQGATPKKVMAATANIDIDGAPALIIIRSVLTPLEEEFNGGTAWIYKFSELLVAKPLGQIITSPLELYAQNLSVADLNGDGQDELLLAGTVGSIWHQYPTAFSEHNHKFLLLAYTGSSWQQQLVDVPNVNNNKLYYSAEFFPGNLRSDTKPEVLFSNMSTFTGEPRFASLGLSTSGQLEVIGPFDLPNFPQENNPKLVPYADVNGDGFSDYVVETTVNGDNNTLRAAIKIYLHNAEGGYSTITSPPYALGDHINRIIAKDDLNSDGIVDPVVVVCRRPTADPFGPCEFFADIYHGIAFGDFSTQTISLADSNPNSIFGMELLALRGLQGVRLVLNGETRMTDARGEAKFSRLLQQPSISASRGGFSFSLSEQSKISSAGHGTIVLRATKEASSGGGSGSGGTPDFVLSSKVSPSKVPTSGGLVKVALKVKSTKVKSAVVKIAGKKTKFQTTKSMTKSVKKGVTTLSANIKIASLKSKLKVGKKSIKGEKLKVTAILHIGSKNHVVAIKELPVK